MSRRPGLLAQIRADLLAQDRFGIAEGWAPQGSGAGAWWHRYKRSHHAAGIMILYRVREWARRRPSLFLPGLCDRLIEIVHGSTIGRDVILGTGVYFPHGQSHIHGQTSIGDCTVVGVDAGIGLRGSFFSDDMGTKGPTIGSYVRIGTGAKVLGAVTIGDRAVVGAGAVVLNDVPEAATVAGVPAKIIRQGPTGDELPAALERLAALRALAAAEAAGGRSPETGSD